MTGRSFRCPAGVLMAGAILGLWPSPADAQLLGAGSSLGGYGASSDSGGGMGGGGAMVIPYGGMTEGFMPGRMGGGSSLSFRSRPVATMSTTRAPSIFSPSSGGMSSGAGGMGRGVGSRSSMSTSMTSRGIGAGGSSFRLGSGGSGMGVMPPSIGYPFRQPPSLLPPSTAGVGMSM